MKNSLRSISSYFQPSAYVRFPSMSQLDFLNIMVLGKKKKKKKKAPFYAVDVLEALQRDILSQPRSPLFHARAKIELETTIKRAMLGRH